MILKNCKLVSSKKIESCDILIEDGRIKEISRTLKRRGEEAINVRNRYVIPGIVDAHVHMRDFKESYKEDFYSGSRAALAGGVTTFIDMPNTKPPVTNSKIFRKRIKTAEKKSLADFGINFGITSGNLKEAEKIAPAAYKLYLDGTLDEINDDVLIRAFKKLGNLCIHAEDYKEIKKNQRNLKDKENILVHSMLRNPGVEEAAVKKVCALAKTNKSKAHICHISSRGSLPYLNGYITCEVTPHHLLLTDRALAEKKGIAKTNPPLRSSRDIIELWKALKQGRIDMIASDHAPHALDEKEANAGEIPSGIPNIEISLKLLLTQVRKRIITLNKVVEVMSERPAEIFNIKGKGEVKAGKDADLVILDIKKESVIDPSEFYSKAKYSPFDGWKTTGDVSTVILRGEIAFEDGEFWVKKGFGECVNKQ